MRGGYYKSPMDNARFKRTMLDEMDWIGLSDKAYRALMRLVAITAASQTGTMYSDPDDGYLDYSDEEFSRACRLYLKEWLSIKDELTPYFDKTEKGWILNRNWIEINEITPNILRPSISPSTRISVLQQSNYQCGYCGTTEPPFDIDHIIPISRGGCNTKQNLICACAKCNRSKGAKTPKEWVSA